MSFLHPYFLFALLAIAIPIIIHLFHFRKYKKIYFSNTEFLEKISDETRKQARLKHLLVLFSRILAIICLVMAFARPYIHTRETALNMTGNAISIFIDNSFSMEAGAPWNLLDQARQTASEIAALFDPGDKYMLLTKDFEARHQRWVSRDEFITMLQEVEFSPSVRNISEIMARHANLLNEEGGDDQKLAFLLSDFQKNISDFEQVKSDTMINYFMIPIQAPSVGNVFIDSVWIDNPVRMRGQIITVQVRVYNDTDQILENQPVRLYVNENQRAVATFTASPHSHTIISLTYTIDNEIQQQGYAEINDHPVTFDDRYYFSFNISDNIPVMIINQDSQNRFLNTLLNADTTFIVRNVQAGSIDFSLFGSQNLIILNHLIAPGSGLVQELARYVNQGGHLLIFPSPESSLDAYRLLFQEMNMGAYASKSGPARVTFLNDLHPVYADVFDRIPQNLNLPVAEQYFVIERRTRDRSQFLMQFQNGDAFITSAPSGQGMVYTSAVPADDTFSNFPRHAMFVPTLYNIALHSTSFYPLSYIMGQDEFISIRNYRPTAGSVFRIVSDQLDVIPESRIVNNNINLILHGQLQEHGNYQLLSERHLLRVLSFNYNRRESLLGNLSNRQLEEKLENFPSDNLHIFDPTRISIQKQLEMMKGGIQLWKIFLLAALFFLFSEVLLIRFLK
jgi:hypothetical protein